MWTLQELPGRQTEIIDLLRQRSRPYLFSNALAPSIVSASIKVLQLLSASTAYRDRLMDNAAYFRIEMKNAGFDIKEGIHPIVPIIIGDAAVARTMAEKLLEKGVYAISFSYPVVSA